jgi:hypothetical protein
MKVHNTLVIEANRPRKYKGDSDKGKRREARIEKGFEVGGYACLPSDPVSLKILKITDSEYLKLEGLEYLVTPCTAQPAQKPRRT